MDNVIPIGCWTNSLASEPEDYVFVLMLVTCHIQAALHHILLIGTSMVTENSRERIVVCYPSRNCGQFNQQCTTNF